MHRRLVSALLAMLGATIGAFLLGACTGPPPACTANWVGPVGGDFHDASSWDSGVVPGAATVACAAPGSSIVVTDPQNISNAQFAGNTTIAATGSLSLTAAESSLADLDLAGTLGGTGALKVTDFSWTGGSLAGSGTTTVTGSASVGGGVVRLDDSRTLTLAGATAVTAGTIEACDTSTIIVSGTSTLAGPGLAVTGTGCPEASAARLAIAPTGTVVVSGSTTIDRPLDNTGVLQVVGTTVLDLDGPFTQTVGTVDLADAGSTLRVAGGTGAFAPAAGAVTGTGTIAADWAGTATLAPGPTVPAGSSGTLRVTGNYAPVTAGHLSLDLAGPTPGSSHDQLVVDGTTDLTTTAVVVAYAAGYTPPSAQTYTVVSSAGALTGPLLSLDPPSGTGVGLRTIYGASTLTLAVNQCDRAVYHPHASLIEAAVGKSSGPTTSLRDCDLRSADFDGAVFNRVDFTGADLRGASFNGAAFTNVTFTGANLTGALVRNTSFASLHSWAICPDGTNSSANASPNQGTCLGHTLSTTFTVNSTIDAVDVLPGDLICQTSVAGQCTLRAAVQEANAVPGPGLIDIPASTTVTLSIGGTGEDLAATGDLDVTDSLAVRGTATSTIDGGGLDRVLDVHGDVAAMVELLKVRNGNSDGIIRGSSANLTLNGPISNSGGVGVVNGGNAYISGSTVSAHALGGLTNTGTAFVKSATLDGGTTAITNAGQLTIKTATTVKNAGIGLDNSGTATLTGTTFDTNATGISGPGVLAFTSGTITRSNVGLATGGPVTLNTSTVTANQTGIDSTGPMSLTATTVSSNPVGGIRSAGQLSLTTSIVDRNGRGVDAASSVTMSQSTISNNAGVGPAPSGGLVLSGTTSTVSIDRSTIGQNSAFGISAAGGTVTVTDSTIGHNGTAEIQTTGASIALTSSIVDAGAAHPACLGPSASYTSNDWNLASDGTCAMTQANDLEGIDALLGRVGANGGSTTTMLPLLGSAAIDSGPPTCSVKDQRNSPRPVDGDDDAVAVCDRGAVEVATYHPLDLLVNATGNATDASPGDGVCQTAVIGECTFTAAVTEANASYGPDTVTLQQGASYGPLGMQVTTPLRIIGNQARLATANATALLVVNAPVDLEVSDVDASTGNRPFLWVADVGGLAALTRVSLNTMTVVNSGTLRFDRVGDNGAIDNRGELTMIDSSVSGADVKTAVGASSRLERTTVSGKTSASGAAVVNNGSTTLIDSTITANAGGGVQNVGGSVTVSNSVIADQTSGPDCTGTVVSEGWNLASDGSCGFGETTDLPAVPAQLGSALSWQGVSSRQPIAGSAAMDSGRPDCSGVDVRGVPRPTDGDGDGTSGCDRGAVEVGSAQDLHLTVNAVVDGRDARAGDGVCETAVPAECTLRAAIEESNATPGTDDIELAPLTYTLLMTTSSDVRSTSAVPVFSSIALQGNGATIDFNGATYYDRPDLEVLGTATMTIDDLRMGGGIVAAEATLRLSRVMVGEGVIDSGGSLELNDSTITGEGYEYTWNVAQGRGVINRGAATIVRMLERDNVTAITNTGTLSVQDSTLHNPIQNRGQLELVRSSMDGRPRLDTVTGIATLDPAAVTAVRDTTISGYSTGVSMVAGSTTIERSTITDNRGVGVSSTGGAVSMTDSVITDSGATDCAGTIGSGGRNIASDTSCGLASAGDMNDTDPLLAPATDRGQHHIRQPMTGSPAIDSGDPACGATDELGSTRPVDGDEDGTAACDRGAIELGPSTSLSLVVDSPDDVVDAAPGDGQCQTSAPVRCTLRAAIMEANATNGPDTITLTRTTFTVAVPNNLPDDDAGAFGDFDITSAIVLHGNGATIDGVTDYDGFHVFAAQATFAVDHLKLTHAIIAINNEGGTLDLETVTISDSDTAITNSEQIDADHLVTTGTPNGSTNSGTFNAVDSLIGGSTLHNSGSVTLTRTTITGGDAVDATSTTARLSLVTSTVAGNLRLAGSTADIVESTIVGGYNTVIDPGPGTTVTGSILTTASPIGMVCTAPLTSGGWNIGSDDSCALTAPTDLQDTDPMLGSWEALSIAAITAKPLSGSPAIDSGRPGCGGLDQRLLARPADGDDNGVAVCDRGAVERGRLQPLSIVVNATNDAEDAHPGDGACETATPGECTLRAAITETNVSEGSDTITLQAGATYVIDPDLGRMTIATDVSIAGNNAIVDGHLVSGLFRIIAPSDVVVTDLTMTRSSPLDFFSTAAVRVDQGASAALTRVTLSYIEGSTIVNHGQLTISDSLIEHNPVVWIPVIENYGTAEIVGTTIDSNATGVWNRGDLTITSSTLSATGSMGLALYAYDHSTTRLHTTTVSGNLGGGIYLYAGALAWIYDSTITGNGDAGLWANTMTLMAVQNSIVANHTWDCFGSAQILSGGYNLSSNNTCGFAAGTDKPNTAANLGVLADNGGPTLTHMPNVGSAALDTGNPLCAPSDQRGVARPRGSGCDRGSVER